MGAGGRGEMTSLHQCFPLPHTCTDGGEHFCQASCAFLVHLNLLVRVLLQTTWYRGCGWEGVAEFSCSLFQAFISWGCFCFVGLVFFCGGVDLEINPSLSYLFEPPFGLCWSFMFSAWSKMTVQLSRKSSFVPSPHWAEAGRGTSAAGAGRQLYSEKIKIL